MDIPFSFSQSYVGLSGTLYSLAFSSDDRYLMSCHNFSPYRENPDRISHAYLTYDHTNFVLVMVKAAVVLTLVGRIERDKSVFPASDNDRVGDPEYRMSSRVMVVRFQFSVITDSLEAGIVNQVPEYPLRKTSGWLVLFSGTD